MDTPVLNVFPEVEREIVGLLARVSPDSRKIDRKISQLEERLGPRVYSEFFYILCHLDFPPRIAKSHWESLLAHREQLSGALGNPVDFRVALLDYFITVNHHLENPKIIEIQIFQKTQDSAIRDELTGLHNFRYFRSELDRELKRALRDGHSVSLALFDVDDFKWYNDRNGHVAGDRALQGAARIIRENVRDGDLVARYGGEEFAVIMPQAGKPSALDAAQRICDKVAAHTFPYGLHQPQGRLTISGGVATFRADATDVTSLIETADRGLYMAKGRGKNQIMAADDETREYRRVRAEIPGKLQLLESESRTFLTTDICEKGMQLHCDFEVRKGDLFRFKLSLEGASREVQGVARACRVSRDRDDGRYRVGAQILELSFEESQLLREYLERREAERAGD